MIRSSRIGVMVCAGLLLAMLAGGLSTHPSEAAKRRRLRAPKAAAAQPADVLLYLPDNCRMLGTINFEAMRDSPGIAQLAKQNPALGEIPALVEEWIGLDPSRIKQLTYAAAEPEKDDRAGEDDDASAHVEVIELTGPVTAEEVLRGLKKYAPYEWREEKAGRVTLFVERSDKPRALFLPDERTVVIGTAELLRAAIRRNAPAELPEKLASAREQLDGAQLLSLAVMVKDDIDAKEIPIIPDDVLEGLDAFLVHLDVVSQVHLRVGILCRDETVAYQIKGIFGVGWKYVRTFIDAAIEADDDNDVPQDAIELIDSLKYAVNGRSFAVQVAIPTGLLADTDVESVRSRISDLSDLTALVRPMLPVRFAVGRAPPGPVFMEGKIMPIEEGTTSSTPVFPSRGNYDTPPSLPNRPAVYSGYPPQSGYSSDPYGSTPATYGASPPTVTTFASPTPETEAELQPWKEWKERGDKLVTTRQKYIEASQQRIERLEQACWNLKSRLELAEKDRDLCEQRADLYRRALAKQVQQGDLHPEEASVWNGGPAAEHLAPQGGSTDIKRLPKPIWDPYAPAPAVLIPEEARAPSTTAPAAEEKPPSTDASAVPNPIEDGPGPSVMGPGPSMIAPGPARQQPGMGQVAFVGPEGMKIRWDVRRPGAFDSEPLICPGRHNFPVGAIYNFPGGAIYRLKLTDIPGRPGLELYPTLEIASAMPRTESFLAHNAIPVQFTEEDFDTLLEGQFVTKVIYLPDPEFQELALAGVETLVSTRLDPGVDPIVEADRRGAILAILRVDGKFLNTSDADAPPPAPLGTPLLPRPTGVITVPGPPHVRLGLPKEAGPPADPAPRPLPKPAEEKTSA